MIKPTINQMEEALFNGLMLAADVNCRNVGIPPLCRRKAGLTKDQSMESLIAALERFGRKKTSVNEVKVVLYDESFLSELQWHKDFLKERLHDL